MNVHKESGVTYLAAIGALSLLALTSAGCANQASDSPAPLSRNTTIVMPTRTVRTTVAVAEKPANAPTSDTNAGPGGATGTEDGIAGRIDAAIIHNTQMTGSRIAAVVDSSGVATLNGTVQNAQQKALADKAARETPGVMSLKDKLQIRPTGGAGGTRTAARVLTAMPDGDGSDASASSENAPTTPAAAPTPNVVVLTNYVPVPQQTASNNTAPTINVTVVPPDNSNRSASDSAYYGAASNGDYGYADYGNDNYGNAPSNVSFGYDAISPSPAGVLNSRFVPGYLRTMNSANEYHNYLNNTGQ